MAVGEAAKVAGSEFRAWVSSWAVSAAIEALEGMEGMDVMELKRESRRGRLCVERAEIDELRLQGLGEELREVKGETSEDVQSPYGREEVLLVDERKEKFLSNIMAPG